MLGFDRLRVFRSEGGECMRIIDGHVQGRAAKREPSQRGKGFRGLHKQRLWLAERKPVERNVDEATEAHQNAASGNMMDSITSGSHPPPLLKGDSSRYTSAD